MAVYEWNCDDCNIYWERDYTIGTNPKKTKCPECNKLSERYWGGGAPAVHFKGAGWTCAVGVQKTGGSDEINAKLQEESKERMENGWKAYAKYSPSDGYIEDQGGRRLNEEELTEKLDASRKLSAHHYDKAGIDPHKKYKPQ